MIAFIEEHREAWDVRASGTVYCHLMSVFQLHGVVILSRFLQA